MRQADFADFIGATQTTVSRWETGAQIPNPAQQHRLLALLQQHRPPLERYLIEACRRDLGWSLITDAEFRLVAASPRVRQTYGVAMQEGGSCWGLFGDPGDTHARENLSLGMPLGLILLRQHLVASIGIPVGHLFAIQEHPIPTSSGEYLTLTRGYILTPEEAAAARARGWETTLHSDGTENYKK